MKEKLTKQDQIDVCNVRLKKAHEALWYALTVQVENGHSGVGEDCIGCEIIRRAKTALGINQ